MISISQSVSVNVSHCCHLVGIAAPEKLLELRLLPDQLNEVSPLAARELEVDPWLFPHQEREDLLLVVLQGQHGRGAFTVPLYLLRLKLKV